MTSLGIDESAVQQHALELLEGLGWDIGGALPGPDSLYSERSGYEQVVLEFRLREAIARLNPDLPAAAREDALRRVTRPEGSSLEHRNRHFHQMLVNGVTVEYRSSDDGIRGAQARIIDFDRPENNDWLAFSEFIVREGNHQRRADIVLFVNGLPLGVVEFKNPVDEDATIWTAWSQLQTYKTELPALFSMNELLIVSDGLEARVGTLTSGREWFKPWRIFPDPESADRPGPSHGLQLETMFYGVLHHDRFLSLIRDFVVFEGREGERPVKKIAGYHQFHAVRTAVEETRRAALMRDDPPSEPDRKPGGEPGDRRIGVVWHTQGAGKSLTMLFYAGRIIREPDMGNPTIVVLSDRNDLDDQLFGVFARCQELLRQPPAQAESRADLRRKLEVEAGGVVFTTIQKFFPDEKGDRHPILSERRNIVVIADEAHRSQYDFIDGYARHMRDALPHASFVGFTGTPVEQQDANTRAVFGDYISVYDIKRSVDDRATVPIFYESRLARLSLNEEQRPVIDETFEEVTEGEEVERKDKLKHKWAQLEAVVGAEERLRAVAEDIVGHFENRLEALDGKAMVVCMSRRICVDLFREITRLRPDWGDPADDRGRIKIVMTGAASDPADWQRHIRNKTRREALANRFRDPEDPLRMVLVRDMWLTGFDAPSLHTMYLDKPMRGHGLMQAIARVNRVFKDKPGGLVVDYLGIAHELKEALAVYSDSGGRGDVAPDQKQARDLLQEKYEVCLGLLHGFDWSGWTEGSNMERLKMLPAAFEHILAQSDGKDRFVRAVRETSRAFALAVPHPYTAEIRDDVAFFQAVRAGLMKRTAGEGKPEKTLDQAVRQILSLAVVSEGVMDVFAAAGLDKPDISVLSDEFLAEVRDMPRRHLAVEALQRLLKGEVRNRRGRNVVQGEMFSQMLEDAIRRYQNRSIEAAQVIEELIELAREMRAANERGEQLGLSEEETAFYDALETNDSAVQVMGDAVLCQIARELVETVRANAKIDWTRREDVRAQLRVAVKRLLRRHGYPPDKQEKATDTVIKQAEALTITWLT